MIVKNEESNIERCLSSVRDYVDEMLVLDTGSSDLTPLLAREQGAIVRFGQWENDFSKARNQSLQQARGEWILYLDADEELPPETGRELRRLANKSEAEAFSFKIINFTSSSDGAQKSQGINIRMFKNNPNYVFEGALHEQIQPSILRHNPEAKILYTDLEILHYGYCLNNPERTKKTQRNIAILLQMLAEKPADDFSHYNLGVSYYVNGQWEKAREHYHLAKKYASKTASYLPGLFRNYAVCLCSLGEYETFLNLLQEGLSLFPDYPDLYFLQGQVYTDLKLYVAAEDSFLQCLRFTKVNPNYISTTGVTNYLACEQLADIYCYLQQWNKALDYQLRAVNSGAKTYAAAQRLAQIASQHFLSPEETFSFLQNNLTHLKHLDLIKLLFKINEHRLFLQKLESIPQPTPGILLLGIKSCLYLRDWSKIKRLISQIPPGSKELEEARLLVCIGNIISSDAETPVIDNLEVTVNEFANINNPCSSSFLNFAYQLIIYDQKQALKFFAQVLNSNDLPVFYHQLSQYAFSHNNYPLTQKLQVMAISHGYRDSDILNLLGQTFTKLGHDIEGVYLGILACREQQDSKNYILLLNNLSQYFINSLQNITASLPHFPLINKHFLSLSTFKAKLARKEESFCQLP
ncbi:glycosyltransferase family 2 protein [Desulforamulus reducens]|nr:glycosyltransferase family 2 protein [Desulforamulus reducens]